MSQSPNPDLPPADALAPDAGSPRLAVIIGTRPEAIKVAPVVLALRAQGLVLPIMIGSGQHDAPVSQALATFGLAPDIMLACDRQNGSLAEFAALFGPALEAVLTDLAPAAVLVHGDTITASVGALTGFWHQLPVIHLEAGLRSGDLSRPFPEEGNRKIIDHITSLLLAPTDAAAANLAAEGLSPEHTLVTGNTVVDAIQFAAQLDTPWADPAVARLVASDRRLALVTIHRRESWGEPMRRTLDAINQLVDRYPDLGLVVPAHPNPAMRDALLAGLPPSERVVICDPLPYPDLARLLRRSTLVLSDSGGIQEEAPSFGTPVIVLREVTERPEAVWAGTAHLAGTDPARIIALAAAYLDAAAPPHTFANPFGDGAAGDRCAQAIAWHLGLAPAPAPFASGRAASPAESSQLPLFAGALA